MICPVCNENHDTKIEAERCKQIVDRWKNMKNAHKKMEGLSTAIINKGEQFESFYLTLE